MVTPSDSSEDQVRCGMCGNLNPPDAEICLHCGSRLKPITASDDLLGSAPPGSSTEEGSASIGDLMDDMRAQFGDDDLSSTTEPPQSPFPEPDMDFSFGSSSGDEDALPSFLSRRQPDKPPEEESEEPPDWLSELEPPAVPAAPKAENALGGISFTEDQQPPQQSVSSSDTPDWLSEFDRLGETAMPIQPGEGSADVPSWLSELAGPPTDKPSAEKPEPETGDLQWLVDYAADDEPDTLIVDTTPAKDEPPTAIIEDVREVAEEAPEGPDKEPRPSVADDAVPDWLADLTVDEERPTKQPEAQPSDEMIPPPLPGPLVEGATPSWLVQQRADEAAEEAAEELAAQVEQQAEGTSKPAEEPALSEEKELVPDWLSSLEEDKEEPIPDWMAELSSSPEPRSAEEPAPLESAEGMGEVPDWMTELSADSTPQPEAAPEPEAEPETEPEPEPEPEAEPEAEAEPEPEPIPEVEMKEQDVDLDWLEQPETEEEEEEDWFAALNFSDEPVTPVGEDLLGLSSDLTPIEEEPVASAAPATDEEIAKAVDFGDLPEWLQGMGEVAGMAIPEAERPLTPSANVSSEELAEIQGLRYEAITGQDRSQREEQTESVGALKDVRGVIQPELIFEGSTLTVTEPVQQIIITHAQQQKVELVQHLLERESETFTSVEGKTRLPVVRWLVALLMILAVAGTLLTDTYILPAPEPGPSVLSAHQAIEGITAIDAVVLVAFEYEPDSAGEMDPLAEALLWQLAQKPNVTVYTISTRPAGAAMADAILDRGGIRPRLVANGGTWRNLGYVSGQANGVSSLASGSASDISSPFSFDVSGEPTGLAATSLATASVDHLIVLAARPDDARMWIEQASQPTGIPLIAAVGASAAPLLRPYAGSGQIVGLLVGLNDAVVYWRLNGQQVGRALLSRYNAQAIGSLVATGLILLGGLVYGILSLRNRKEGLS